MKGWVYIISNKSMPGMVKIGYSTKDPELRAQELGHTGSPHPYIVDYEVLIENPRAVESNAHNTLARLREGKEWFRCSAEDAALVIREIVGDNTIHEDFKLLEREAIERTERERAAKKIQRDRQQNLEREKEKLINKINYEHEEHEKQFDRLSNIPLWKYWLISSIVIFVIGVILFVVLNIDLSETWFLALIAIIIGGIIGEFLKDSKSTGINSSYEVQKLRREYEEIHSNRLRLANLGWITIECPECHQQVQYNIYKDSEQRCSKCINTIKRL